MATSLITIAIDKICKMTVRGVKLKWESFFQYLITFWSYEGKAFGEGAGSSPKAKIGLMERRIKTKSQAPNIAIVLDLHEAI